MPRCSASLRARGDALRAAGAADAAGGATFATCAKTLAWMDCAACLTEATGDPSVLVRANGRSPTATWTVAAEPSPSNASIGSCSPAITPNSAPTGTRAPSGTTCLRSTPSVYASSSSTALSVSTSATTSPLATPSPSRLSHFTSTPSSMVSDSLGMMIRPAIGGPRSLSMKGHLRRCRLRAGPHVHTEYAPVRCSAAPCIWRFPEHALYGVLEQASSRDPYTRYNAFLTAAAIRPASGTVAASKGRAYGSGTSRLVTRSTGASKSSKALAEIVAAISAATPQKVQPSCTTTARCVLRADANTVSQSNGRSVRGSTTSTSMSSAASVSAAARASRTILEYAITVQSRPGRTIAAAPSGISGSTSGTSPATPYISSDSITSTGLLSRIAVFKSPRASRGVLGAQTLRPGTWQNHASRACECWAASWRAEPPGPRITKGTETWPPDM